MARTWPRVGPAAERVVRLLRLVPASRAVAAVLYASPVGATYAAPGNTLGFALVSGFLAGSAAANTSSLAAAGAAFGRGGGLAPYSDGSGM